MNTNSTILIIDDEPTCIHYLAKRLNDSYDLLIATNSHEALSIVETELPDLILMDVMLPEINGYELCTKMKQHSRLQPVPVIFVTSENTLEEKLKGYDAGGLDYVSKPYDFDELHAKIKTCLESYSKNKKLNDQVKIANDTAYHAISYNGELGLIIQFLSDANNCSSYEDIGTRLIQTLNELGLNCCIQVRVNDQCINIESNNVIKALEYELIGYAKDQGRILDFGKRSFFNYEKLSLLVKNMPVDDSDKYGRYKEHLCILLNGANEKLDFIAMEEKFNSQRDENIYSLIEETTESLTMIDKTLNQHQLINKTIADNIILEIEATLPSMGLEEDQEKYIIEMLDSNLSKLELQQSAIVAISGAFEKIVNDLKQKLAK